ncbi:MAG: hypothetical protein LBU13_03770 [Synergistaceae bacterium]|jgi:hypothetical protein|nr:hypothetical protein [Synergistaceae bacterium]
MGWFEDLYRDDKPLPQGHGRNRDRKKKEEFTEADFDALYTSIGLTPPAAAHSAGKEFMKGISETAEANADVTAMNTGMIRRAARDTPIEEIWADPKLTTVEKAAIFQALQGNPEELEGLYGARDALEQVNRSVAKSADPGAYQAPETAFGRTLAAVVRSTPYTLQSQAVNAPLSLALGPLGYAVGGAVGASGESQHEQARAYAELIKRGMSPEDAYAAAEKLGKGNFFGLSASNALQNTLEFGSNRLFPGMGKLGRTLLALGLDAGVNAGEEAAQYAGHQRTLGDEIKPGELAYEALVGGLASLVHSGPNMALSAALAEKTPLDEAIEEMAPPPEADPAEDPLSGGYFRVTPDDMTFVPPPAPASNRKEILDWGKAEMDRIEAEGARFSDEGGAAGNAMPEEDLERYNELRDAWKKKDYARLEALRRNAERTAAPAEEAGVTEEIIPPPAAQDSSFEVNPAIWDMLGNPPERIRKALTGSLKLTAEQSMNRGTESISETSTIDGYKYTIAFKNGRYYVNGKEVPMTAQASPAQQSAQVPPAEVPPAAHSSAVLGRSSKVVTNAGTEVDTRFKAVEADDLLSSDREGYPAEVQPRNRGRLASQQQIESIISNLDPTRLADNRLASDGAPIVGGDNVVESGNGRVIALREAYKRGAADKYRQYLMDNAESLGLSKSAIEGMRNPVLVRERVTDTDRVKFAQEANESSVSAMSESETALRDAKNMDAGILESALKTPDLMSNTAFFNDFFEQIIPQNERGQFIDPNGRISQAGYRRVRNALAAKAYGDDSVISRLAESTDDNIRNVNRALVQAAPSVALVRDGIDHGALREDLSLSSPIIEAANALSRLRHEGTKVSVFLSQRSLFDEGSIISPEAGRILAFFDKNKQKPNVMTSFLTDLTQTVEYQGAANQKTIFDDDEAESLSDIIDRVAEKYAPAQAPASQISGADAARELLSPKNPEGAEARKLYNRAKRSALKAGAAEAEAQKAGFDAVVENMRGGSADDASSSVEGRDVHFQDGAIDKKNPPTKSAAGEQVPAAPDTPVPVIEKKRIFDDDTPAWKAQREFPSQVRKDVLSAFGNDGITNRSTGWNLTLSGKGFDHLLNTRSRGELVDIGHFEVMSAMPDLARDAILGNSRPDKKGVPEIERIHEFYLPVRIGEDDYATKLLVKEYKPGVFGIDENSDTPVIVRRIYDHTAKKISAGISPDDESRPRGPAADTYTLRQLMEAVNPSTRKEKTSPGDYGEHSENESSLTRTLDGEAYDKTLPQRPSKLNVKDDVRDQLVKAGESGEYADAADAARKLLSPKNPEGAEARKLYNRAKRSALKAGAAEAEAQKAGFDAVVENMRGGSADDASSSVEGRDVYFQDGAEPVSVEENIRRGNEAMDRVIRDHIDVRDAMYRDDLGGISILWGKPGKGTSGKGGWGVAHIIKRHGESTARKMVEVLAKGVETDQYEHNGTHKIDIEYGGYKAVLAQAINNNERTWLLTGFEKTNKEAGATSEMYGSTLPGATLNESTPHDAVKGAASVEKTIPQRPSKLNVKDDVRDQLVKTGESGEYADAAGDIVSSAMTTFARRAGISPEEFYEKLGLTFERGEVDGEVYLRDQTDKKDPRGAIDFDDPNRIKITLTKTADASTTIHELGHLFRWLTERQAAQFKDDAQLQADWEEIQAFGGHEKFADGFIDYVETGEAPTPGLRRAFQRFKQWLAELWDTITRHDSVLTENMRGVYDRILAGDSMFGTDYGMDSFVDAGSEAQMYQEAAQTAKGAEVSRRASSVSEAAKLLRESGVLNKPLTNNKLGITATISGNSIKEMASEQATYKSVSPHLHALAVANADKLFENASFEVTHPDVYGRKEVNQVHRLGALLKDGAEYHPVKLTVVEYFKNENRIYTIEAIDVEAIKESAGHPVSGESDSARTTPIADFNNRIMRLLDDVKALDKTTFYQGPAEVKSRTTKSGLEIRTPVRDTSNDTGPLDLLNSPSVVAERHPRFKPFFNMGKDAYALQEKLRASFGRVGDKIWNKLITDDQRETFSNILIQGDFEGKVFSNTELREMGAADKTIQAYHMIRAVYAKARRMINEQRRKYGKEEMNELTGYVPHFFHTWRVMDSGGQILDTFRSMREAVNAAEKMGGQGLTVSPFMDDFGGQAQLDAVVLGDMQYLKLLENTKEVFALSTEDARAFLNDAARMKNRSRVFDNAKHRKGAAGWDTDMEYAFRHYMNYTARYIAMDDLKHKGINMFERVYGRFDNDHKGVARYTKDYLNDCLGIPSDWADTLNKWVRNSWLGQHIKDHIGDRPAEMLANNIARVTAIAKLGFFNPMSAAMNFTQLVGASAKIGYGAVAHGMTEYLHPTMRTKALYREAGITENITAENPSGYSNAHNLHGLFGSASMGMFRFADGAVRKVTFLGAYRKGRAEGMSHAEAVEYGKKINDQVNFDYSVADAPNFIRRTGPIGTVAFQFKKFPVKMLEFAGGLKGMENVKFWVPMLALSGLLGVPGFELLKNFVKWVTGGKDIELEMKEFIGESSLPPSVKRTLIYGGLSNIGIDVGRRAGMGDFIPSKASDFAGPAVSTIERVVKTIPQIFDDGNFYDTLDAISPGLSNPIKAFRGTKDKRGREKFTPDTKGEVASRLVGARPIREAIESDAVRIANYDAQRRSAEETAAIGAYLDAREQYSPGDAEYKKALDKLRELKITQERVLAEMRKRRGGSAFERKMKEGKNWKAAERRESMGGYADMWR